MVGRTALQLLITGARPFPGRRGRWLLAQVTLLVLPPPLSGVAVALVGSAVAVTALSTGPGQSPYL